MVQKTKIRNKVEETLKEYGVIDAPIDVEGIAKDLNIRVKYVYFDRNDISGLLVRKGNDTLIAVNREHHSNRQRFTIAHELGHYMLHVGKPVFVDQSTSRFRNATSSEGYDREEIEANYFAAELLMPTMMILSDVGEREFIDEDEVILELASKYGVSVQSLAYRLNSLGYVLDGVNTLKNWAS